MHPRFRAVLTDPAHRNWATGAAMIAAAALILGPVTGRPAATVLGITLAVATLAFAASAPIDHSRTCHLAGSVQTGCVVGLAFTITSGPANNPFLVAATVTALAAVLRPTATAGQQDRRPSNSR